MPQQNEHSLLKDEELLERYRLSRDNQWLGFLLQRYTMLLFGVAMKYLKDRDQAQDAVQQIFIRVLTKLPEEEIRNFKGWLYILMRNHCLQILRDRSYLAPEEALESVSAQETVKEDLLSKNATLEQMHEGLQELNADQRVCLELFYLERKSYQQIMDQTGFTYLQVKSFIQNGKRNLKHILLKKLGHRPS